MKENTKQILETTNLVSFWGFFLGGLGFIVLEIIKKTSENVGAINTIEASLDLPFVFIALVYALTLAKLTFTGGSKMFGDVIVAAGGLFFLVFFYISIFVPNL